MKTLLALTLSFIMVIQLHAQDTRSAFRKGYVRIGISTLGGNLDNSVSPKQNVFNGDYGANTGFVFESGHNYYFKSAKKAGKINYGLDWTIISASYNKLGKWNAYAAASGAENFDDGGTTLSVAVASKLGPVVSFNPVEKLVIDVRFQVAPQLRVSALDYSQDENKSTVQTFSFQNYGEEDVDQNYNSASFKNITAFGVGTNFGISVRRKAIGLALDYTSVKANTSYDAYEGENNHTFGKVKIPTHSLQLKLSFTL